MNVRSSRSTSTPLDLLAVDISSVSSVVGVPGNRHQFSSIRPAVHLHISSLPELPSTGISNLSEIPDINLISLVPIRCNSSESRTFLLKQLLFDVDFTGSTDEPSTLMLREQTAELQARYLTYLDNRPFGKLPLRDAICVGVSAYTIATWREHEVRAKPRAWRRALPGWRDSWRIKALANYLSVFLRI